MHSYRIPYLTTVLLLMACLTSWAQEKRKIIIDQDAAGPAGTDQQSMLLLDPVATDRGLGYHGSDRRSMAQRRIGAHFAHARTHWANGHSRRAGAEYPLVRRKQDTEQWEQQYGSVAWLGAWTPRFYHPPDQLGDMPEGKPTTKPVR